MADPTKPNQPEKEVQPSEIPTDAKLAQLKDEIKSPDKMSEIFNSLKEFLDGAVQKVKDFFIGLPFLKGFFESEKKLGNKAPKASSPEEATDKPGSVTALNIKAVASLGLKLEEIPSYSHYSKIPPRTFGVIKKDGFLVPVYCDPNPEQRTGGSPTVMVPVSIVAHLVKKGYDLKSKQPMHDFMRRQLVAVRLPRTFTGNTKPIMVNPLIADKLTRAFKLMEQRGIRYNIESAGCMCWRGGRGAGLEQKTNYVSIVGNHGFGTAIDFNPGNNPYSKDGRNDFPPGFIESMEEAGFTWGGRWKTPDSMHFEKKYQDLLG